MTEIPTPIDNNPEITSLEPRRRILAPFKRAVLGGLAVVLPPLLTVVIFLWIAGTVQSYILRPVTNGVRDVAAWYLMNQRPASFEGPTRDIDGLKMVRVENGDWYVQLAHGEFIREDVYTTIKEDDPVNDRVQDSAKRLYQRFVELRYLKPYITIPLFAFVFILILYILGKFLAADVGRFFVRLIEGMVLRVPLVSNVYGSVKQVTDFMLNRSDLKITRVAAVQYPRLGIWTLGFVTSENIDDIEKLVNEPVVGMFLPTSPMPFTGYTMWFPKSEVVDIDFTVDQALQWIVSCGVVVPPHKLISRSKKPEEKRIGGKTGAT